MHTPPLRIGYCLSLSGALASNGKTARHLSLREGKAIVMRLSGKVCVVTGTGGSIRCGV
jgi:hypothetical protein